MRKLLLAATVLGAAVAAAPAFAGPIAAGSTFNIQGQSTFDSTTVTFTNPESSLGPNTGSFASFATCTACVTMTSPLTYNPFTAGQVYSGTSGGITTTFSVTSSVSVQNLGSTLIIHDLGTATLTGFDTTPGEWVFTANQSTDEVSGSFSATTEAVPEPASLALLGAGLIGFGLIGRRRNRG